MINKRIIGVVTVRQGWAVQSFGYRRYLPLGRPEVLVENLDRWGADEILLQCIDRSSAGLGPDMALLDRIGKAGLSTPLIYGGGIRSAQDAVDCVNAAADRVAVDALIHDGIDKVARAGAQLGNQAIIGALPLSINDGALCWRDYRSDRAKPLDDALVAALRAGILSEALVIDWRHEGYAGAFDPALVDAMPDGFPLIAFGGISTSDQARNLFGRPPVVAVASGNFLAYREHAIQTLKAGLAGLPVRPAHFAQSTHA